MSDALRGLLETLNELPVSADAERFLAPDDAADRIRRLVARHPDIAHYVQIGESEEGRPIGRDHVGERKPACQFACGQSFRRAGGSGTF